ncbi:MAG: hypothetical protein J6C53_01965 [Clostridia bacterium]|nr:hypothetical protein [Clostridia bacterium]
MTLAEQVLSNKNYTWQLLGNDIRITFTSATIAEAFKKMHRESAERGQELQLLYFRNDHWETWSNTKIYKQTSKGGEKEIEKSGNSTLHIQRRRNGLRRTLP